MRLITPCFSNLAALRAAALFGAFLSLGQTEAYAQASYLQQGFETGGNTPATGSGSNASGGAGGQYIYSATGAGAVYSGTFLAASGNSANALPNPGAIASEGSSSFGAVNNTGNGNSTGIVNLNNVVFPVTTGNYLQFRLASYQTNNNGGLDNATANNGIQVDVAYNGSSTFVPTLRIIGLNNGSVFDYSATGVATASVTSTNPTLQTFTSPDDRTGSGQSLAITGVAGLSTARINFGAAITQVRVRITVAVNGKTGVFIDDIRIGSDGPLPVELKSFTAEPTAKGTQLKWATASESNNAGFDIQRGATATEFITIGRVDGQGTSNRTHSYAWLDAQPLAGLSYYRLRQHDTDGTESFSPVVAVKSGGTAKATFFPNPTTGQIILAAIGPVHYRVLNTIGQTLLTGDAADDGVVDVQALRPGSYFLELQTATGRQVQRFVRE
ncbi:T9SS type A sorting domain-containing protein [Hymenobacter puniceus]|uniref:T9SS type A sorting domain-containing protein n=1 Tax=Hymenobacter sp. BT190 TaxID=2763505 RepID=UPI0016515A2D|nr:T9SS type A sorting domain-containing protein [Hymenobacter sp. BT190]MBC6698381.1 T9SS type A sorting domain-containing protein [Hymenobacter sp. BT190]